MQENFFKTSLAYENWKSKYQFGDESPLDTFKRIAKELASVEEDSDKWESIFLNTMVKFETNEDEEIVVGYKCTPGGRITANAGTTFGKATLMNCFVSGPVKNATIKYNRSSEDNGISYDVKMSTDDNPDDLINIFLTILEQAKTLASEGGYGINFDFIRPRGSIIKGTGIEHPGVVSYMDIWDAVSECIVKGNNDGYIDKIKNHLSKDDIDTVVNIVKKQTRKGAMLGCLTVSHPDIEEFIRVKQESKKLQKFNLSVGMTDDFMEAVEKDGLFDLTFKGVVYKTVKAKELYDLIMKSTYDKAEPGVIFLDNGMKNNPIAYVGKINATNPCGEIPGNPDLTTVCLLGSVNLTQYVEIDEHDNTTHFNWELYKTDVSNFTRMLDNVCDCTKLPLPSYEHAVLNFRQFGMGVNGLGSTLLMLGIPYNSKEAVAFTTEIVKLKENITWKTSALLAKEKEPFPLYDATKFLNTEYFKSDRISDEVKKLIILHGVRNAKTTTNPPCGNTSILCDNVSNGIEPIFSLFVERKVICDWPEGLDTSNIKNLFSKVTRTEFTYWEGEYNGRKYYYEPHNRGLCEVSILQDYGYEWYQEKFPEVDLKKADFLVTTSDLDVEDHLNIQEVVQYYCNQSVSKTVNLPKNYSFTKFKDLYMNAWKKGLVGITTYREGSMESVLDTFEKAEKKQTIIKQDLKLPNEFVNGPTRTIKREGMKFYIHFSFFPEDTDMKFPVAMWIFTNSKSKAVACTRACKSLAALAEKLGISTKIIEETWDKALGDTHHNRLGRFISLCLRHGIPREQILVALQNIEGDNISSLLTAVRKFIGNTLDNGVKLVGMKCPQCNGDNVKMESGCFTCQDCGSSGCG